jgi:hypothetical protein
VSIALDQRDVSACTAGDVDHDQKVTISELISAVGKALAGCPGDGTSH